MDQIRAQLGKQEVFVDYLQRQLAGFPRVWGAGILGSQFPTSPRKQVRFDSDDDQFKFPTH